MNATTATALLSKMTKTVEKSMSSSHTTKIYPLPLHWFDRTFPCFKVHMWIPSPFPSLPLHMNSRCYGTDDPFLYTWIPCVMGQKIRPLYTGMPDVVGVKILPIYMWIPDVMAQKIVPLYK